MARVLSQIMCILTPISINTLIDHQDQAMSKNALSRNSKDSNLLEENDFKPIWQKLIHKDSYRQVKCLKGGKINGNLNQ